MSSFAVAGVAPEIVWCPSLDDDGDGTTTLNDLSGNGHDVTLVGLTWQDDTDAGGVRAISNTSTNYGTLTSVDFDAYTLSCWVKPTNLSSGVIIGSTVPFQWGLRYLNAGNQFRFDGTNTTINETSGERAVDVWQHVVVQRAADGSGLCFTNAKADGSGSLATDTFSIDRFLSYGDGLNAFAGLIDDVRIWGADTPSAATIAKTLYNNGKGRAFQSSGKEVVEDFIEDFVEDFINE